MMRVKVDGNKITSVNGGLLAVFLLVRMFVLRVLEIAVLVFKYNEKNKIKCDKKARSP